jgi:hypothetical protein
VSRLHRRWQCQFTEFDVEDMEALIGDEFGRDRDFDSADDVVQQIDGEYVTFPLLKEIERKLWKRQGKTQVELPITNLEYSLHSSLVYARFN